jgi:hypothetical protein
VCLSSTLGSLSQVRQGDQRASAHRPLLSHFGKKLLASILQHCVCRLTPVLIAFLIGL